MRAEWMPSLPDSKPEFLDDRSWYRLTHRADLTMLGTLFNKLGQVAAIAGVVEHWPGMYEPFCFQDWGLMSLGCKKALVWGFKQAVNYVCVKPGARRIQVVVPFERSYRFVVMRRLLEDLDFVAEAHLASFLPSGDVIVFALILDGDKNG